MNSREERKDAKQVTVKNERWPATPIQFHLAIFASSREAPPAALNALS
jgi:hypothetical protein